jgi:hypothetical protein
MKQAEVQEHRWGNRRRVLWSTSFALAFGFVEAAVVVYLRAIYYPGGFEFPLSVLSLPHFAVECLREAATILMLASVAMLAGSTRWERFGYFALCFGMWDISFYLWLKVVVGWPSTVFDWDVLFLLPVPWIGPVIAPLVISTILIVAGLLVMHRHGQGKVVAPPRVAWIAAIAATLIVLYTFVHDTGATLGGAMPLSFEYGLFTAGCLLYCVAIAATFRPGRL